MRALRLCAIVALGAALGYLFNNSDCFPGNISDDINPIAMLGGAAP